MTASGQPYSGGPAVSLTDVIDRNLSRYQVGIFLLCAMVVFLDGIDTQVVGIGAPLIGRELGIGKASFGWVFAAGTLGATIGALACGVIADRLGRKGTLIVATAVFGVFTLATAFVTGYDSLLLCRFATGIGLGGAVPCFVALTSEYAPTNRRATVVSLLWAAFPLGAAVGALINSYIVFAIGWRPLFLLWGAAPLAVAALHLFVLPESVRFLLTRGGDPARVAAILNRIEPGSATAGQRFTADEPSMVRKSPAELFSPALRTASWSLSLTALAVFGLLTVAASWMPTLLTPYGFTPAMGAIVVASNGFGSFFGTTSAGFLLERVGVLRCVVPALVGAAVSFTALGIVTGSFGLVVAASFAAGLFLGVSSSSMLAMAALTYPTAIRSTGVGWAMGMGRFGSVVAPLLVGLTVRAEWPILGVMLALSLVSAAAIPCVLVLARTRSLRGREAVTAVLPSVAG